MKKLAITCIALAGLGSASALDQICSQSFNYQTGDYNMTCQCPTGTFQTGFEVNENDYDMNDEGTITLHCESPADWI